MHTNYNRITDSTPELTVIIAKQSDSAAKEMRTLFAIQNAIITNTAYKDRIKWVNLGLNKYKTEFPDSSVSLFTFTSGANVEETDIVPHNRWTQTYLLPYLQQPTETIESVDFENVLRYGIEMFTDIKVFASPLFQTAASVTSGRVVYVREDSVAARTAHQFMKAFGDLTNDYQIIDQKYIDPSGGKEIDFKFNVDNSLMNGDSPKTKTLRGYIQGFIVTIDKSDDISSEFQLTATRADTSESVIAVAEFATNSVDDTIIKAQCWLNTQVFDPKTDTNRPVMAYVNIHRKLDELIANVSVKLSVIYDAKGSQPKPIDMYDNGSGAPDITKGDGIFSNYITDIENQGYYTVSADIANIESTVDFTTNFGSTSLPKTSSDTACCGSRVDGKLDSITLSVTKLSRKLECGTLFVTDNPKHDYPPNPVRDLRVESVEYENRTINLLWTASGGDYTTGFTDKYTIKAFHQNDNHEDDEKQLQEIRTKFNNLDSADISVTIDTMADRYGKEQRCQIRFNTDTGGVYYVALRASDTDKYESVVSNVVLAYIKSNVIIQSTTAFANDVSIYQVIGNGNSGVGPLTWWEILLIAIGGAVVLIIIGIFFICCICKRRRKEDDTDRETTAKREAPVPARRAPEPPQRVSPELEKNRSILLDDTSLTRSVEKIPNIQINSLQQNNAYNTGSQHMNNGYHSGSLQSHNNGYNSGPQLNNGFNSGSQQNLRELNVNALSPVQSWDAKDLLNHWGRVQEAKQRQEAPPVMRIEDLESASSNHSPSYASSDDDNIYTNPNAWRYNDVNARPSYVIPNGYNEPIYQRTSLDPHAAMRSNTPSDTVPRYSTIIRKPTQNVSQV
ncbi:unnamed protein product [Oppiella nova]|uniref:Uncharacterized protein n=1 Tax=Oppiella nova TaxID=334625 RepID=A0A7R9QC68_9ACAR|nr:unnamed protein product [Oppiella nova]CAG2162997.1 unnamed protein product [Oppiella nova]